ncbi:DegT/DnrJ/EryC1/StrS family aminotransferase [Schaedlerella arabinosiphila]|uniref:DegT/DnrJ/EryC1/StrS family aminotransferase n=1 Tax=Schaedlerella arabinosiphila TaxID=2044587 RepID=A0A9X5C532_9FIRM|nr:DegT/DnrJ/EryC1/StrS family aminotransferase [Schaedlerella arabinosiphila]KAI4443533.1 UDP-2-acetamido-2-deoxy-3-oxo-D-glucuronate aminotransferase [Schaedlerella arabinosiphila]NDO68159.1 DegT/DnrJ/EryC1/StrS family aminotransferase [Schaedlerella arabinosiphila]
MEFIDLSRQYDVIKKEIDAGIKNVIESRHFIMGPEVAELEERLAEFVGRKYCLTSSSGTDALQIPLMTYELSKEDAVFVPSFTFFASAESVNLAGATPVFVDIDSSFNMSVDSLEMEIRRVLDEGNLKPKGIIPVDLFGRSANYDAILPIAEKYDLFVLEDAAQGFGGSLHGKRNGAFGNVSITSFFPAKPLGCYGDGGAIFTDDEELYKKMKSIRVHGMGANRYDNIRLGMNGRLDTLQAAIVLAKLDIFEDELEARQQVASWYTEELKDTFVVPETDLEYYSAWAQYTLRAENEGKRNKIINGMREKDIPVMIYYPIPLHEQTAYKNLGYSGVKLPYCSMVSKQVFSVPMHPYLKYDEVRLICDALKSIV